MLSHKEIASRVRAAFLPFRCAVQIGTFDAKLRFMVFDHRGIVERPKIPLQQAQDRRQLERMLEQVRRRVQAKGYTLSGRQFA